MKFVQQSNVIERSGDFKDSKFTIDMTSTMFDTLSGRLYSNEVRAVIRELCTNAYDSHVEAGVGDKPFDVHLPTRYEPYFSVRDFGVGMSEEDVYKVLTHYGSSSKRDSNSVIGCLGLGAKSPFAISDSFIIITCKDGRKLTFNAYKDENCIPSIALISEEETTEVGVEFNVAVPEDKFYEFDTEASYVLQHFPIKPNLTGRQISIDSPSYNYSGAGWFLQPKYSNEGQSNVAVMGNVCYPIEESKFSPKFHGLFNAGVALYFEIGDVEFVPSREAVKYTKRTLRTIRKRLARIVWFMQEELAKSISSLKTDWEAFQYITSEYDNQNRNSIWKIFNLSIEWKGKKYDLSRNYGFEYPKIDISAKQIEVRYYNGGKCEAKSSNKIPCRKNTKIVVDDMDRGAISAMSEINGQAWLLKTSPRVSHQHVLKWLKLKYGLELGENLILASSLQQPIKYLAADKEKTVTCKLLNFVEPKHNKQGELSYWIDCPIPISKSEHIYYVEVKRGKIKDCDGEWKHPEKFVSLANWLTEHGYTLRGIRTGKKIWPHWTNWIIFGKQELENYVAANNLSYLRQINATYKDFMYNEYLCLDGLLNKEIKLASLIKNAKKSITGHTKWEEHNKIAQICYRQGIQIGGIAIDLNIGFQEAIDEFPLIKAINSWNILNHKNDLASYINSLHQSKQGV